MKLLQNPTRHKPLELLNLDKSSNYISMRKVTKKLCHNLHVKCTLGLGCLLSGTITNQSCALGQAKVKGQQGAMLHADGPQCRTINLHRQRWTTERLKSQRSNISQWLVFFNSVQPNNHLYLRCEVAEHQPAAFPWATVTPARAWEELKIKQLRLFYISGWVLYNMYPNQL